MVLSENKNSQRQVAIYEVDKNFKLTQLHVDKDLLRGFSRINMIEKNKNVLLSGTNGVIFFLLILNLKKQMAELYLHKLK